MTEKRERTSRNGVGCIQKVKETKKILVAYDRLMNMTAKEAAKKHDVSEGTISRWENGDEDYARIVEKHCADIRRGVTSKLLRTMGDVAANVMAAAKTDPELGFKVLKELGAFKTAGNDVGMTQAEVQAAGGVTIVVMGAVGSDGTPVIDVDAVVDGDVDVNG